ncbi:hypothetical protein SAMN05421788_106280 [Filimonas lacunae]|uniref:Pirin N-terminal domain-containing protein n=1 Tax=Filimonas lacunae TaxID=477680 RepID=A0A173MF31_9BACT|nr:pirin family protein [Filimonas lacunae]BAV06213.1 pirin family protein [Filimonas lacunae]SIT25299.1 hypothetical protein SAMN05421788_106280 [Filimonas lacunae]
MAQSVLHTAASRGVADHGWLKSFQSFSFSGYYNPERIQFGALRVLNDDIVEGGQGFGKHPHDNMEIISIPLEGELKHQDSMGNAAVIKPGEIQVMSAGTGIYHTEYNNLPQQPAQFLQIWLFPNKRNVTPRYDQISYQQQAVPNQWQQLLSPNPDDAGVWIYQDAWFHKGVFDANTTVPYQLKKAGNGVYVFVIDGSITINGQQLNSRDALGVWDTDAISITTNSKADILLIEVPMTVA